MDWSTLTNFCVDGGNNGGACASDTDCPNGSCGSTDVVHLYHDIVVPSKLVLGGGTIESPAEYEIQVKESTCPPQSESNYSDPLVLTQAGWGDVVEDCTQCPCGPPEDTVNLVTDIVSLISKFQNLDCAPSKTRSDLQPANVDFKVDFVDVVQCLGAFTGGSYPFVPEGDPCSP
jgi:hypothetical protein